MSIRNNLKQGIRDTFSDASSIFGYVENAAAINTADWVPVCRYWSEGDKYHTKNQSVVQYIRSFFETRTDIFDFKVFEYLHEDCIYEHRNGSSTWVLAVWVEEDGLKYLEIECFDEYK